MTTMWLSFAVYSWVLQPCEGRSKDPSFPPTDPCSIHNPFPWHLTHPSQAYSHLCQAQPAAEHIPSHNTAELCHFCQCWGHQECLLMLWDAISPRGICPLFFNLSLSCSRNGNSSSRQHAQAGREVLKCSDNIFCSNGYSLSPLSKIE